MGKPLTRTPTIIWHFSQCALLKLLPKNVNELLVIPIFILGDKADACSFQALETDIQKFGGLDRIAEEINRKGWN